MWGFIDFFEKNGDLMHMIDRALKFSSCFSHHYVSKKLFYLYLMNKNKK